MNKIKKFIITLIKAQFFTKHIYMYIIVPVILSFIISFINIGSGKIEYTITDLITIIGITGGLLLNFLTILLTDNSTILVSIKGKKDRKNIYGEFKVGAKKFPTTRYINYYYSMYYRIFFLIFSSIIFILLYIISFLGITELVGLIDVKIKNLFYGFLNIEVNFKIINYGVIKYILITSYLYFIMLYFISLSHLIYRLYYLFHNKEDFTH